MKKSFESTVYVLQKNCKIGKQKLESVPKQIEKKRDLFQPHPTCNPCVVDSKLKIFFLKEKKEKTWSHITTLVLRCTKIGKRRRESEGD